MKNAHLFVTYLFLVFSTIAVFAQTQTNITGTVIDSDSQVWVGASIIAMISSPSGPPVYVATGQPVQPVYMTLNSSGAFVSAQLPNNSTANIVPAGTCWRLTIYSVTSAMPQTIPCVTIPTGSYDMGTFASANITALRFAAGSSRYAYNTTEIVGPESGTGYTNTVSNTTWLFNGSTYIQVGGSSSACPTCIVTTAGINSGAVPEGAGSGGHTIENSSLSIVPNGLTPITPGTLDFSNSGNSVNVSGITINGNQMTTSGAPIDVSNRTFRFNGLNPYNLPVNTACTAANTWASIFADISGNTYCVQATGTSNKIATSNDNPVSPPESQLFVVTDGNGNYEANPLNLATNFVCQSNGDNCIIAGTSNYGMVSPDNTSTYIAGGSSISAYLATSTHVGEVIPDNTSITIDNTTHVISAVGGLSLGGTLSNTNCAVQAAAGTGASCDLTGQDGNHQLSFTSGSTSSVSELPLVIVTFTTSRGRVTYCSLTPANTNAAFAVGTGSTWIAITGNSNVYDLAFEDSMGNSLATSTNFLFAVSCP